MVSNYDISALTVLEEKFGFHYPELYRRAFVDGMLDGRNATDENPTLLLPGGFDIEFMELDFVEKTINQYGDPNDYRKIPATFQFVPFAETGSGDQYVFQFDLTDGDDVPVTLLHHDWEEAQLLAKSFEDFLFRSLIEEATSVDERYSDIFEIDAREAILRTHQPYLKPSHFAILTDIYHRDLTDFDIKYPSGRVEKHHGFLTITEQGELFAAQIPYVRLNEEFRYMG